MLGFRHTKLILFSVLKILLIWQSLYETHQTQTLYQINKFLNL